MFIFGDDLEYDQIELNQMYFIVEREGQTIRDEIKCI